MNSTPLTDPILAAARVAALTHEGFSTVDASASAVRCTAKRSLAPAYFELQLRGSEYWVRMLTADRWLSESVEGDVLEGDPIDELLEEELAELGWRGKVGELKHFRDEQKVYVYEHKVPAVSAKPLVETAALFLVAYARTFEQLGDMQSGASAD